MTSLRAVMFFVDDQLAAARWYRDFVVQAGDVVEEQGYVFIDLAGFEVGFHPSDPARNPRGGSTVAYFSTDELDAARARALAAGAALHRGPLDIDEHRAICQLVDPFGNIFGFDGPRVRSSA